MSHFSSVSSAIIVCSVRTLVLEKYVAYGAPEIAPVSGEGVLVVGVDISFLRGLDIVQGDGGVFVVIKGRQQTGLYACVQVLHLGSVQAEVLPAQRSYSDQLHLSLEDIYEHRKLVQPGAAQELAPAVHAVVARELATVLETFVLEHIGLKVLRVRVHSAELVNSDHIAVIADSIELYERAVGGIVVPDGGAELPSEDVVFTVVETLVDDFKTGTVHTTEKFYTVVGTVLTLGHPEIKPAGPFQFRTDSVPDVVTVIHESAWNAGMRLVDNLALEARSARVNPEIATVHECFIGFVEEGVEVAYARECHLVDDEFGFMGLKTVKRCSTVGVYDEGRVLELLHMTVQPVVDLVDTHLESGLEDGFDIGIGGEMLFKLCPGLHARLGVVLRDELLFVP